MVEHSDNGHLFRQEGSSAAVTRHGDESAVVTLAGEFDLSTAAELLACLMGPEVIDAQRVQVDLTGVKFLDSSSIGLLVSACKRVRSAGGAFSVRCADGLARRVLEISGLIDFFDVANAGQGSCDTQHSATRV